MVVEITYRYKNDNMLVITGKYTTGKIIYMSPSTHLQSQLLDWSRNSASINGVMVDFPPTSSVNITTL